MTFGEAVYRAVRRWEVAPSVDTWEAVKALTGRMPLESCTALCTSGPGKLLFSVEHEDYLGTVAVTVTFEGVMAESDPIEPWLSLVFDDWFSSLVEV